MVVCMVSVLISFFFEPGTCIRYPNSNKLHPRPPAPNGTLSNQSLYPNCPNYTAMYTGLSLDTLEGNIHGLWQLVSFSLG